MITPNDVPASRLIQKVATYLKENVDQVTPPTWASVAKTGTHVEKQPQNSDWWYTRCASVFRKAYVHGPIGIQKLRAEYGGNKGVGQTPEHSAKAGGTVIRKALQQLEAAGFVQKAPRGRKVTREGKKLLQELSEEVGRELIKENPELAKYEKGE